MTLSRILIFASILSFIAGGAMLLGGVFGIVYTHQQIVAEKITTTPDSAIPNTSVAGPMTLKAQADVVLVHMLKMTDGKRFAEMPRTLPKLDDAGNPMLDEKGEALTVPNTARDMWFNAMSVRSALQLGILSYAFSALSLVLGLLFLVNGCVFCALRKREAKG